MKQKIEHIYQNTNLQEGHRIIEQLLIECYMNPGIATKQLARELLLPVPVAAAIKRELIRAGALRQDRGVSCTTEGRIYVEHELGFGGMDKGLYHRLLSDETDWREELAEELLKMGPLFAGRPQVDVRIDQSQCTLETSMARAILCLRQHSFIGKRVLCVGDDDLVSVALGFLLQRLFPHAAKWKAEITVIDIDERYVRYIDDIAQREGLPIRCCLADLRHPLPEGLLGQFDSFFTDPPYTLQGLSLFLSRGICALKKEKGLPVFLSFAHKSPDYMLDMQREFVRMGLTVKEAIPHFNAYEGAEMIGNRSQMLLLSTTGHTAPGLVGTYEAELYTGEVKRTLRTYRCKQCGHSTAVGTGGTKTTIEELKQSGCPRCRHDTFERIDKQSV